MESVRDLRSTQRGAVGLVFCLLLFIAGCGPSVEPTFPIKGKLLVRGKPAVNADLILHPVGGSERLQKLRPHGTCDQSGEFTLSTHNPGDGAPLGTFKVTVVWPGPAKAGAEGDPEIIQGSGDQLQGRYAHDRPQASPVEVTIAAGQSELPPLDLIMTGEVPPRPAFLLASPLALHSSRYISFGAFDGQLP